MVETPKLKDLNFPILHYTKYKKRSSDRSCDIQLPPSTSRHIKSEALSCVIREPLLGGLGGAIYICLKVKQDLY